MTACDGVAAVVATADLHVEAAIDHRAWNLRLILRRDVGFAHVPLAAVRTLLRQRHVVGLVDPRRHAAMGMRTMTLARLATRRLRFRDRRSLRERSRLSLAPATLFFQRRSQLRHLLAQRSHQRFQLRDSNLKFAATRARRRGSIGVHERRK